MKKKVEILILFILSLTPLSWLGNNWVIFGHDSGFRSAIHTHYKSLYTGWSASVNAGIDLSLYKGFLIIQLPELILQSILGSIEYAQLFILPFWFFLMAIGMYIAIHGFFPKKKYWFLRLYTSIFWVFNFYILQAWGIAERAKFSLYAALPISICLLSKTFERKISIVLGSVMFSFLYFLCNGGGSPPLFGASVVVWIITATYWTLVLVKRNGIKELAFGIKVLFSYLLGFLLINMYWILMDVELYRATYQYVVNQGGGIDGLLAWEKVISRSASIVNLLRLQGMPDWIDNPIHPFSNDFMNNPVLITLSFFPITVIILGIIFGWRRIKNIYDKQLLILFGILGLIGLFFAAGSHPPTGALYVLFMKHIPGFAIFRSSFYKFAPVLWFSIIFLSGYFLQLFLSNLTYWKKSLLSCLLLVCLVTYHYPYFQSTFFQFAPQFSTRVKIPDYVKETGKYLNSRDRGRVLLLPELDRGFINLPIDTYSWGFYSLDVLPRLISDRSIIANDSNDEIVLALYNSLYESDWKKFKSLANYLHISQLLYRNDYQPSTTKPARTVSPELLNDQFGLPIFTSGEWSIYQLNDVNPHISTETNIISMVGSFKHESVAMNEDTTAVHINATNEDLAILIDSNYAIEAECLYCAVDEYASYSQSIILPSVKILPGSFFYPIYEYKKMPKINSYLSPSQSIDTSLARMMIRLSEYIRIIQYGDSSITKYLLEDYVASINNINNQFKLLLGRDQINYANRLLAYGLKQQEFFTLLNTAIPLELTMLIEHVRLYSWISDESAYRLIITIPSEGLYKGIISNKNDVYQLNNTIYSSHEEVMLPEGLHKIEISRNQNSITSIPTIVFQSNKETIATNPPSISIISDKPTNKILDIEESVQPYVVIFPESFDPRWQISLIKGNTTYIRHVRVNGYANGWLIASEEPIRLQLSYALEQTFYIGLLISVGSVIFGIIFIIIFIKKSKTT